MMSRWPATAAVAATIVALSHVAPEDMPHAPLFLHADKVAHFVEYLALGALVFRSLLYELAGNLRLAAIITVSAGMLFGALDEWHQTFAGRTADLSDVLADIAGLACGTALVLIATRRRRAHAD